MAFMHMALKRVVCKPKACDFKTTWGLKHYVNNCESNDLYTHVSRAVHVYVKRNGQRYVQKRFLL